VRLTVGKHNDRRELIPVFHPVGVLGDYILIDLGAALCACVDDYFL
jgi:hypothetical protein